MDVLEEPVLVLNKNWQYVAVSTAREALSALFAGVASAIDPETYAIYTFEDWVERGVHPGRPFLHGVKIDFEIPEVIVLSEFEVEEIGDLRLEATVRGEKVEPGGLGPTTEIKAATFHQLLVERRGDTWFARVIFDV